MTTTRTLSQSLAHVLNRPSYSGHYCRWTHQACRSIAVQAATLAGGLVGMTLSRPVVDADTDTATPEAYRTPSDLIVSGQVSYTLPYAKDSEAYGLVLSMLGAMDVSVKDGQAEAAKSSKAMLASALDAVGERVDRLRDLLVVALDPEAAAGLALAIDRTRATIREAVNAAAKCAGSTPEAVTARIEAAINRGGKRVPEAIRTDLRAMLPWVSEGFTAAAPIVAPPVVTPEDGAPEASTEGEASEVSEADADADAEDAAAEAEAELSKV